MTVDEACQDGCVERGTVFYEQDACISVQGQGNTIVSALVVPVGKLGWIHTRRSNTFTTTDVRATGRKSFNAFTLDFFDTVITVAALPQTETVTMTVC